MRDHLSIEVDGVLVESDGPPEALDAIQRDAVRVVLPAPPNPGPVLRRWVEEVIGEGQER